MAWFFNIFKKKEKEKKPYKFPPNVYFYKDEEIVWKTYVEVGGQIADAIEKAKKEYGADHYRTFSPTGNSSWISIEKKKRKPWGFTSRG
jgi:hypothetical protein